MTQRPEIPENEYDQPMGGGGDREPLALLPDREWLKAKISGVKFQYSIYNNQIQHIKDDQDNDILDNDGNPIRRREFEIQFELLDYQLPNGKPRKQWLRMSASRGERAHLPVFLANILPTDFVEIKTPKDVIDALEGQNVYLQLSNRQGKKDPSRTYQNVIFDAVKKGNGEAPLLPVQTEPYKEEDFSQVDQDPSQQEDGDDTIPF